VAKEQSFATKPHCGEKQVTNGYGPYVSKFAEQIQKIARIQRPAALTFQFVMLAWLILAPAALAQTTATITGTVADPTGAVVPKAKITLKRSASGDTRESVSNASGYFSFTRVVPGTYDLSVNASGFKIWETKNLQVHPGDERDISNIHLQIGATSETVTVEANTIAPVDSGERSALLNSKQIQNLSLEGRDVTELIKIMPGMAVFAGGDINNQSGFDPSVVNVGSSTLGNGFISNGNVNRGGMDLTADGAHIVDPGCNCGATQTVNADMVAEVKVQTSNFGADSAKGPVVVNAIGKSGSSEYHGQANFYVRKTGWDANRWDNNNQSLPRGNDNKYYPNGQLGGPVPFTHKKVVFFSGYEYYHQELASQTIQSYVPTQSMRNGNFSSTALDNAALCSNSSGSLFSICSLAPGIGGHGNLNGVLLNGTSFSGTGLIPVGAMDPGGVALMNMYPAANTDPTTNPGGFNFVLPINTQQNGWMFHTRLDYDYSKNTKVYVTYNQQRQGDTIPIRPFFSQPRSLPFPGGISSSDASHTVSGHVLHIFSPAFTNDGSISLAYLNLPIRPNNPSLVSRSTIGYPYRGVFANGDPYAPALSNSFFLSQGALDNFDLFSGQGNNGAFLLRKLAPSFQDDVTWNYRKHIFKFGIYWERTINDQSDFNQPNGEVAFDSFGPYFPSSPIPGVTGPSFGSNNAWANQLLGAVGFIGYNEQNFQAVNNMSYRSLAFYASDSWKLFKGLTLDLGIRFTNYTPWRDDSGKTGLAVFRQSLFQSDAAAGSTQPGLRWHSIDSSVPNGGAPTKLALIDPRFGVAWDAFGQGKTIFRGGFGAYHFHDSFNDFAGALSTASGSRPFHTGVPNTLANLQTVTPTAVVTGAFAISPTDDEQPVTYSYNFTISQQGPWKSIFELAYVGNHTNHLMIEGSGSSNFQNLSLIPLGALFQPDRVTGFNPIVPGNNAATAQNIQNLNTADYRPFGTFCAVAVRPCPSASVIQGYGDNGLLLTRHGGWANYNALQASWNRSTGQFTFGFNYTFSKALGLCGTSQFSCAVPDPTNLAHDYGVLSLDRSHIFNSSYQIDLGNLSRYLKIGDDAARFLKPLIDGWTIAGITTLQSGPDLASIRTNFSLQNGLPNNLNSKSILGTPDISIQPVLLCDPRKGLKPHQYMNGACFGLPGNGAVATGTNGAYQLPYIKGPAFMNSDLSLYKGFKVTERQSLQLRASAFNFLNHPLWSFNPNGNAISLHMAQNASGQFVNTNNQFGFADIKYGQRTLELAVRYSF
jgi:hypothetical protein